MGRRSIQALRQNLVAKVFEHDSNNIYNQFKDRVGEIFTAEVHHVRAREVILLDDDGNGNVRRYYLSSGIRTYSNETQGTINYTTGQITLNSLNVASISNIRGATSTVIELTVTPNSNDVVPVRDQIVEIDIANSTINVTADSFVGGSADAGVGYTTTSSY